MTTTRVVGDGYYPLFRRCEAAKDLIPIRLAGNATVPFDASRD
jgi:hypothetical protein